MRTTAQLILGHDFRPSGLKPQQNKYERIGFYHKVHPQEGATKDIHRFAYLGGGGGAGEGGMGGGRGVWRKGELGSPTRHEDCPFHLSYLNNLF